VFYAKLYVHSLDDKLKWFYGNARCYNKIYTHVFRIHRCVCICLRKTSPKKESLPTHY